MDLVLGSRSVCELVAASEDAERVGPYLQSCYEGVPGVEDGVPVPVACLRGEPVRTEAVNARDLSAHANNVGQRVIWRGGVPVDVDGSDDPSVANRNVDANRPPDSPFDHELSGVDRRSHLRR